jgi:hypothetical protein
VKQIPFGMTTKSQQQFAERLADKLNIAAEEVEAALMAIVREDVLRIARNDVGGRHGNSEGKYN